jgi:hypothetical protein
MKKPGSESDLQDGAAAAQAFVSITNTTSQSSFRVSRETLSFFKSCPKPDVTSDSEVASHRRGCGTVHVRSANAARDLKSV